MKPTIVPFVKWVGGKRQLMDELVKRVPKEYGTYFEPFVGGGALLFELQPKKAVVSDLNEELINTYKVIKKKYKLLKEYLLLMEYGHSESFYKKIATIDRNDPSDHRLLSMKDSDVLRAARFIYLNKAGFNGLYRVNSSGMFNVPWGQKINVKTHEWPNIELAAKYLKTSDVQLKTQKFTAVQNKTVKDDFVYLDPPYDYEPGKKGFDSYQKEGFGTEGQKQLAKFCKALNEKGVKFMVSNHNTKLINELYKEFNIEVIKAKRLVGGKGASREDVEEVIITNYDYK